MTKTKLIIVLTVICTSSMFSQERTAGIPLFAIAPLGWPRDSMLDVEKELLKYDLNKNKLQIDNHIISAAQDGQVVKCESNSRGEGKIDIKYKSGLRIIYCGINEILVKEKTMVKQNQRIGILDKRTKKPIPLFMLITRETVEKLSVYSASTIEAELPNGTMIHSVIAGMVKALGYDMDHGRGNFLEVASGDLNISFDHLSRFSVVREKQVTQGETLGATGSTGNVAGPSFSMEIIDCVGDTRHYFCFIVVDEDGF